MISPVYGERNSMSDMSRCFDCGASRAPLGALHLSSIALACPACDPLTVLYADACALQRALSDGGWPTDAAMAASHLLRSVTCAPLPRPQRAMLAERLRGDIYCVGLYEGFCPSVWTTPRSGSYTQGPVAVAVADAPALTVFGGEGVHLV